MPIDPHGLGLLLLISKPWWLPKLSRVDANDIGDNHPACERWMKHLERKKFLP